MRICASHLKLRLCGISKGKKKPYRNCAALPHLFLYPLQDLKRDNCYQALELGIYSRLNEKVLIEANSLD
jgi:hypothetical protein